MRAFRLYILAAVLFLSACSESCSFTFMQMSDPQLGFGEENGFVVGQQHLQMSVAQINDLKPDFVIVTGDLVNSWKDSMQVEAFNKEMAQIDKGIKVYLLPGNHDIPECGEADLRAYRDNFGEDRFFFFHKGSAFLGLNSSLIRLGSDEQRAEHCAWIEEQLKKCAGAGHVYVFMHYPIVTSRLDENETYSNFPVALRREYLDLFKKYGVECIFAGHLHQSFDCDLEGVRMVTCGPSGLPLGKGIPGYNIVEVSKNAPAVVTYKTLE